MFPITLPNAICTFEEFRQTIKYIQKNFWLKVYPVYRGEEDFSWELKPNLLRYNKSIPELNEIQKSLVPEFIKNLDEAGLAGHMQPGFLNHKFHTDWLFQQQAQHLGVPTRFMDWSLNAYIALFFAVKGNFDRDGRFMIFFPHPDWFAGDRPEDVYWDFSPLVYQKPLVLNPSGLADTSDVIKFAERFKRRQQGRFFVQPLDKAAVCLRQQAEFSQNILSIVIPKDCKEQLLKELDEEEGINASWLFMHKETKEFMPKIMVIISKLKEIYGLIP